MEKNNLFGKNDVAKNSFKINNYDQVTSIYIQS